MTVNRGAARHREAHQWAGELAATAAGVWMAALLVPDFDVAGSAGERATVVAIVVVAYAVATALVPLPVARLVRRAVERNAAHVMNRPDLGLPDGEFLARVRRMMLLSAAGGTIILAMILVGAPSALWLSITMLDKAGLPTRLSGFWPTIVAALVIFSSHVVLGRLLAWPSGPGRARTHASALAGDALETAGLLLALAILDGVALVAAPGEPAALSFVVIAGMFVVLNVQVTATCLTTVIGIAVNALRLWLVSWLSSWMVVGLAIRGFWTFLLTATLIWALAIPGRLAQRRRKPQRRQQHMLDDTMQREMLLHEVHRRHTPWTPMS